MAEPTDPELARRVQMLATEHWGLLAARGTAQSEVLTRITIFLTLVSAGLLTIGLLGQATRFSDWFAGAALAILAFLALVGLLTAIRVMNASEEDMMYVVAMNRLRGAYADIDPAAARYFLASTTDDELGMKLTYSFLRTRGASHLLGSSSMLIFLVNACVFGLLGGGVVLTLEGSVGAAIASGSALGVLVLAALFAYSAATFTGTWRRYRPLRATQGPPAHRMPPTT